MSFLVGRVVLLSGVSGAFLEFSDEWSVFLATVAAFLDASPIEEEMRQYGGLGDMYRYRNDTNKLRHFQSVDVFEAECFFFLKGGCFLPSTSLDVLARTFFLCLVVSHTSDHILTFTRACVWLKMFTGVV